MSRPKKLPLGARVTLFVGAALIIGFLISLIYHIGWSFT
jgi:hypothetical protein